MLAGPGALYQARGLGPGARDSEPGPLTGTDSELGPLGLTGGTGKPGPANVVTARVTALRLAAAPGPGPAAAAAQAVTECGASERRPGTTRLVACNSDCDCQCE